MDYFRPQPPRELEFDTDRLVTMPATLRRQAKNPKVYTADGIMSSDRCLATRWSDGGVAFVGDRRLCCALTKSLRGEQNGDHSVKHRRSEQRGRLINARKGSNRAQPAAVRAGPIVWRSSVRTVGLPRGKKSPLESPKNGKIAILFATGDSAAAIF
jgi:hypothetical protein